MTKAVVDREGVLLEVEYDEPDHEDGPVITSVRVLGHDYIATGPNLNNMLDQMFLLTNPGEGEPFLNGVVSELS